MEGRNDQQFQLLFTYFQVDIPKHPSIHSTLNSSEIHSLVASLLNHPKAFRVLSEISLIWGCLDGNQCILSEVVHLASSRNGVFIQTADSGSRWESKGRNTCSCEQRSEDSESDHYSYSNFTETAN